MAKGNNDNIEAARSEQENISSATPQFSLKTAVIILCAIVLLVYANTLRCGFVLDDASVFTENTIVKKGIAGIPELLATPRLKGFAQVGADAYRPLSLVLFAIEYQLSGASPVLPHLVNIALFAVCVILLFLFVNELLDRQRMGVAFVAALLFALHPLHTEVVANIKSADELLCFLFGFLSLNMFMKYGWDGRTAQLLSGACCFLLSLLAKETSISFLAIIPFTFFLYRSDDKRRSLYITGAAIAAAAIFLCIRIAVISAYNVGNIGEVSIIDNLLVAPGLPFESKVATSILIAGYYLRLLVVPYPLICDYSYGSIPFAHFTDLWVLVIISAYLFLVIFSIMRLRKNRKDRYAYAILFFLFTEVMFTNILFIIGAAMAERFMFFGSVGLCIAVALLLDQLSGNKLQTIPQLLSSRKVLYILVPLCLLYSGLTIARNNEWVDNYTLFSADIAKNPDAVRLNQLLGQELLKRADTGSYDPAQKTQMISDGIKYVSKAIAIYPDFGDAHATLGSGYLAAQQLDSAGIHLRRALELNPADNNAVNGLAGVYFAKRQFSQAIELCRRSIQLNPGYVVAYINAGTAYLRLRQFDSAIYYLKTVTLLAPDHPAANKFISLSYRELGNMDSAKKYEQQQQRIDPNFRIN